MRLLLLTACLCSAQAPLADDIVDAVVSSSIAATVPSATATRSTSASAASVIIGRVENSVSIVGNNNNETMIRASDGQLRILACTTRISI
jgi:hypothetical protein